MAQRIAAFIGALCLLSTGVSFAADGKAEIVVNNNTAQSVTMRFEYAFRNYKWKLVEHAIDAGDDLTYRFPANIPGCEYLREWQITDGVLSIWDSRGLFCDKRISLCDKRSSTLDVQAQACYWKDR